ncbi:MAG: hypothetical protein Q7T48_18455 [Cellvibrio sp.]|uniref:hypothetical protein n=1 Tax=Cellvibrio sp. TaxID=1965322 RepID=UPI002727AA88|nr:hypothetical protein [Cellvibrio sp.]
MNVKWLDKSTHTSLIKQIKSDLKVGGDNSISFKPGIEFLIDALFEKIEHPYKMDGDILFKIFNLSLQEIIRNNELSRSDKILAEFKKRCDEKLRNLSNYVLVTSISLEQKHLPKRREINNCRIRFYKKTPEKYVESRKTIINKHSLLNLSEQETFTTVTISVSAPDVKTAFQNAITSLNVLRSIWQINFHKKTNFLASNKNSKYPSSSFISLGQTHTLHLPKGESACDMIWYEPELLKSTPVNIANFNDTEKLLTSTLQRIRKSPLKDHIEKALNKYISATDEKNHELRKMKIWSSIEHTLKTDSSNEIKKRISFFYEDATLHSEIIESLRKSRNEITHGGKRPTNIELKNFQLSQIAEHLIRFYIDNPFKRESIEEMLSLLSSPINSNDIDRTIKNLLIVKKFRKQ